MSISSELEEAKSKRSDSLPEVVRKIGVFSKTQGGVIRAYASRLRDQGDGAPKEAREAVQKLQGLMDQLDATMAQLSGSASEAERKLK